MNAERHHAHPQQSPELADRMREYMVAAASPGNLALKEIVARMDELVALIEDYADGGHGESCECASCDWNSFRASDEIGEDLSAARWTLRTAASLLGGFVLRTPDEILESAARLMPHDSDDSDEPVTVEAV